MAKTDAGQIRIRSTGSRRSGPRWEVKSFSKDSRIRGTIAPIAPNRAIIRKPGSGCVSSFGRTALYGVAADGPRLAGPRIRAKLAPGLRSCRLGSFFKFSSKVEQPFARLEVKCCSGEPIAPLCVGEQIAGDFAQQIWALGDFRHATAAIRPRPRQAPYRSLRSVHRFRSATPRRARALGFSGPWPSERATLSIADSDPAGARFPRV